MKYDLDISAEAFSVNLQRLTNQIYKLLPIREEGADWQKPLETTVEELAGMSRLFFDQQPLLLQLICKLEGLFIFQETSQFMQYRRCIFECLNLLGDFRQYVRVK